MSEDMFELEDDHEALYAMFSDQLSEGAKRTYRAIVELRNLKIARNDPEPGHFTERELVEYMRSMN